MDNFTILPLFLNRTVINVSWIGDLNISDNNSNTTDNGNGSSVDMGFLFPEPYATILVVSSWLIIPLVIVSLFGNTLIIIIMSRGKNRKSSTSVFFMALAVSDMFMAISVSFERWLLRNYQLSLYNINSQLTAAKVAQTYTNIQLSAWILVCITIERMTSIALPYVVKEICTRRLAHIVVVVLVVIFATFNALQFTQIVNLYLDETNNVLLIDKVTNGEKIIQWLDFTFSFFIPITILVLGSIFIVISLARVKIQKHDMKMNRNNSVTRTLLAANLVFILTMSPYLILKLLFPIIYEWISVYMFWTLTDIFLLLSDMNCALNFFVYVLSGARFRADAKELLCCKKKTTKARSNAVITAHTAVASSAEKDSSVYVADTAAVTSNGDHNT